MSEVLTFDIVDSIAVITIDSPPVNALGFATRVGLQEGFEKAWASKEAKAIVLTCGGRTFFAGADISEFGTERKGPDLGELLKQIESSPIPVIAAIHGTALGGGYELALQCNYRIAVPSAKCGLPEVNLGLLPGAGGTQRLPRIVGIPAALDLITSGNPVPAPKALELGMIDALAEEGKLREDAIAFARKLLDSGAPLLRVRDRQDMVDPYRGKSEIYDEFRAKNARAFRGFKAPENIIKAIQAAADLPFEQGIEREKELFQELVESSESDAQRYVFFAERQTSKIPDVPADTPVRDIKKVGVIGAGTMGGGITMNFLQLGLPVVLLEMTQEALDRGIGVIRKNYEISASRGRLTQAQVDQYMSLIQPSTSYDDLADCDLVTEVVFELLEIKKEVFKKMDAVMKKGAILASNTSFLDLNQIADATSRPEDVIGHHYFSPANVMPLLEVVRGAKTAKDAIATSMKLAKSIGKIPVLAGVCDGFVANRVMRPRSNQASAMVLEGVPFEKIDKVAYNYGFAMGPFQMIDLVGLDVVGRDSTEKTVQSELVAAERLGQKKNGGYYDYNEKRQSTGSSPVAQKIIADLAAEKGIAQKPDMDEETILARMLYPIVNMGARLLEEGIAIRASDIDIATIKGYNWPVYRGGPMHWANHVGLPKILAKLQEFEATYGPGEYTPSALLMRLVAEGKDFSAL